MAWIISLVLIAISAAVAYTFGKRSSPAQQQINELESIVLEKEAELQQYKKQVTSHFEQSAKLFGKVTEEYQALYHFMANSSQSLAGEQPFKTALPQSDTKAIEGSFKGSDTFSDEQYYHAHDYRIKNEEEQKPSASADVVQLKKSKEEKVDDDSDHPALDYAIKEKGVINHNSLNMENVKSK